MTNPKPRNPAVLAYRATRDAQTTEDARQVYEAAKASPCYRGDTCTLNGCCPFYVDCVIAEGGDSAGG